MKPTLLILTDWFVPGYKAGGPIRSCLNLARALKNDYQIKILTGDRDFGDDAAYQGIELDRWVGLEEGIAVCYLSPAQQRFKGMWQAIRLAEGDFIYLNSMFSVGFTIIPLLLFRFGKIKGKIILAPRGMLHAGALQYKALKKRIFLLVINLLGFGPRLIWHATDQQEASDIRSHLWGVRTVHIASNFPEMKQKPLEVPEKQVDRLKITFLSRISQKKNLVFLLDALTRVKAEIRLDIAGPIEDEKYWQTCLEWIEKMPSNVQIFTHGAVNHQEAQHLLKKNHIFVLPTHGENFGHAIFEALLKGRPVIISPLTPWNNIEFHSAGLVVPLQQPEGLAAVIEDFAKQDQEAYAVWANGAWVYAQNFLRTSKLPERYKEVFA